jgi:hypothetical protein
MLQVFFKYASSMLQVCFKYDSSMLQVCFKKASWKLKVCFNYDLLLGEVEDVGLDWMSLGEVQ